MTGIRVREGMGALAEDAVEEESCIRLYRGYPLIGRARKRILKIIQVMYLA